QRWHRQALLLRRETLSRRSQQKKSPRNLTLVRSRQFVGTRAAMMPLRRARSTQRRQRPPRSQKTKSYVADVVAAVLTGKAPLPLLSCLRRRKRVRRILKVQCQRHAWLSVGSAAKTDFEHCSKPKAMTLLCFHRLLRQ